MYILAVQDTSNSPVSTKPRSLRIRPPPHPEPQKMQRELPISADANELRERLVSAPDQDSAPDHSKTFIRRCTPDHGCTPGHSCPVHDNICAPDHGCTPNQNICPCRTRVGHHGHRASGL